MPWAGLCLIVLALAGSAQAECPSGLKPVQTAELVFGRDVGEALGVTEADWRTFVESEITPRFPNGFTVSDASGQWRGPSGRLVHEPSKLVLIVLTAAPDDGARLEAIRGAYKARFHQDAVLLIEESACAGF